MTDVATTAFIVRHGSMRFLGEFSAPQSAEVRRGDVVILRTERGQEAGEVLCIATPQTVAAIPEPTRGEIIRVATTEDREKIARVATQQKQQFATGEKLVAQHHLAMQIVDVEYLLGGERLIFYFLAEGRVDFRELVKSMAREFHTRIELRQIGVRDEAKLLADYGDCGKPVCCNTHMVV
ncbi:MAG: PSP1 domain-containing protein, partial [Planctomycetia bacterium]|nr:PSP1 domain-containing protein [Planctomycetia bacterium]